MDGWVEERMDELSSTDSTALRLHFTQRRRVHAAPLQRTRLCGRQGSLPIIILLFFLVLLLLSLILLFLSLILFLFFFHFFFIFFFLFFFLLLLFPSSLHHHHHHHHHRQQRARHPSIWSPLLDTLTELPVL